MTAVREGRQIKVLIGQVALTRPPNTLQTVLGSCVGLVLYDQHAGIAGLAHILLPSSRGAPSTDLPGKYADQAIACMIAGLLEHGAEPRRLRAKLAGGARMFPHAAANGQQDVGAANITAVRSHLREHGIAILGEDVGGDHGRRATLSLTDYAYVIDDFSRIRVQL